LRDRSRFYESGRETGTAMSPRTRSCDSMTARERLKAAESYVQAAELIAGFDDEYDPYRPNSMISNYVLAGIAAADALCCFALGEHSQGDDHRGAVRLVERVTPGGRDFGKALSALLTLKTEAGYGARPLTDEKAKRARRNAAKLVEAARDRGIR